MYNRSYVLLAVDWCSVVMRIIDEYVPWLLYHVKDGHVTHSKNVFKAFPCTCLGSAFGSRYQRYRMSPNTRRGAPEKLKWVPFTLSTTGRDHFRRRVVQRASDLGLIKREGRDRHFVLTNKGKIYLFKALLEVKGE